MSFRTGITVYTFLGISFARKLDSEDHEPWFYADPTFQKDVVLGGAKVYLDKGALVSPPLSFRASCLNAGDRIALINALWTTATLVNSRSHTGTVTLVKARPINSGNNSRFWLDVSFELRP